MEEGVGCWAGCLRGMAFLTKSLEHRCGEKCGKGVGEDVWEGVGGGGERVWERV